MSTKKPNGADNSNDNVSPFPKTLAERDRLRKEKLKQEKKWQQEYKRANHEPFLKVGNLPPATKIFAAALLLINIPLFFLPELKVTAIFNLGFLPAEFTQKTMSLHALATVFTHVFIHADFMHLAFNVIMTLALGMFFERTHGTKRAVVFFWLCALAGAAVFFALRPEGREPLVGASAGLSGLFAALIIMIADMKRVQNALPVPNKYGAWPMLAFWLVLMTVIGLIGGGRSIAWQAHLGGFVAGIGVYHAMKKGYLKI